MVFPMQETPERYITTSATGAKEPWEMVFELVFFSSVEGTDTLSTRRTTRRILIGCGAPSRE